MSITTPQHAAATPHHYGPASVREIPRRLQAVTTDTFGGLTASFTPNIRSCL
jgi:hypothetical protein